MVSAGSASKSKWRGYILGIVFGFAAGVLVGVASASNELIKWGGELTAGDVVGGLFNLAAILAVPFVVDALREKRNREQQLLEGWAADALTALRETHDAYDDGAPGPMSDDTFDAVKRGTKKLAGLIAMIEQAVGAWKYSVALRTQVNSIAIDMNAYADAVGEKRRAVDDVKSARATFTKLRNSLVDLLPALRG